MTSRTERTWRNAGADVSAVDVEMPAIDESLLSIDDVAMLASTSGQLPEPTLLRLAAANRTDPRFEKHYEALVGLARDAGFDPVRDEDLETALDCHRDFALLLQTEGWEHPAEIIDPDGEIGVYYRELAHIAAAHEERKQGAREKAVREKLERAWTVRRERLAPVETFVSHLLEQDDETAKKLLKQAKIDYQSQRKQGEQTAPSSGRR